MHHSKDLVLTFIMMLIISRVTEIDNYVILNILQNFYFREYSIFVHQF